MAKQMHLVAILLFAILLLPQVSACLDTEPARIWENQAPPAAEGLSSDKDGSIRTTVEISKIGQETARFMLWRAMMGENLTEAQIRDEVDRAMVENGTNPDWPSFDTIIASGSNAAIPHGDGDNKGAGPRQVGMGDTVVVDLGARVDDWVSDITRTYSLGQPNETVLDAYMTVYEAQNLTFPLIEAGTQAWTLDNLAREYIKSKGYGEYFIHSLGHGFGVCVHERPLLSSGVDDPLFGLTYNQDFLTNIDAITIEPGIYIPEMEFGIRIEDDFLVNNGGHEFVSEIIPRDAEWFIILEGDYDPVEMGVPWIEVSSGEGEEDESNSIPWFGAPLEMLLTIGLAAVLLRRQD
jgi:hypothetical protein